MAPVWTCLGWLITILLKDFLERLILPGFSWVVCLQVVVLLLSAGSLETQENPEPRLLWGFASVPHDARQRRGLGAVVHVLWHLLRQLLHHIWPQHGRTVGWWWLGTEESCRGSCWGIAFYNFTFILKPNSVSPQPLFLASHCKV